MTSLLYSAADLYTQCGYADPGYVIADEFCRGGSGAGASPGITAPKPRPTRPTAETLALLQQTRKPITSTRDRVVSEIYDAKAEREAAERQAQVDAYLARIEKQRRQAMADQAVNTYAPDKRGAKIVVQTPKGPRLMTVADAVRKFYENQG